jgi:monofunctional biosynthetic peptidoglycan transglycosylase
VDAFYLAYIWPDWSRLAHGPLPKSRFMVDYEQARRDHPDWPALRWRPVPFSRIPKPVIRAVIIAEDARFYEHSGFDLVAIKDAFDYNLDKGKVVYGASTISQQTAKNLFLRPSRDPLRKWHEAVLTFFMERHLSKQRILELYLNVAEFGRGVYGVDAAARTYWGKPVARVTPAQAAELAATLPSPVRSNPRTRTRFFLHHANKIRARLYRALGIPANGEPEPGIGSRVRNFFHRLFGPSDPEDDEGDN